MSELSKFEELLTKKIQSLIPVQTHWVICSSVDWDKKTMDCKGQNDDLEYFDVLLGLGNTFTKPKADTKCLIGVIANKSAAAFLIYATEADEFYFETSNTQMKLEVQGDTWKWNDGNNKGIVKVDPLVQKLNNLESKVNDIISWSTSHTHPTPSGASGVPVLGVTGNLTATQVADLENDKIKH